MPETIGSLVDKLVTTNIKVYHLVDVIQEEEDDTKVANAARKAQRLNKERAQLVNEIDLRLEGKESIIKV